MMRMVISLGNSDDDDTGDDMDDQVRDVIGCYLEGSCWMLC